MFSKYMGFFWEISGFCKNYEAFKSHFQKSGGFFKLIWGFYKDNYAFLKKNQINGGFCWEMWGFYTDSIIFEDFLEKLRLFQRLRGFLTTGIEAFFKWCEAFSLMSLWLLQNLLSPRLFCPSQHLYTCRRTLHKITR
jgi:hypothetical protein